MMYARNDLMQSKAIHRMVIVGCGSTDRLTPKERIYRQFVCASLVSRTKAASEEFSFVDKWPINRSKQSTRL